jgi:TonB-dependent SusC/RagA subfamily outer membrane receptor
MVVLIYAFTILSNTFRVNFVIFTCIRSENRAKERITPNKYSTTRSVEAAAKDEAIAKKRKIIKPNKLSPLVYLDGVEIESTDNVNPEDIESIDVIKDKTATALYGEKGKNGVIFITSKKTH